MPLVSSVEPHRIADELEHLHTAIEALEAAGVRVSLAGVPEEPQVDRRFHLLTPGERALADQRLLDLLYQWEDPGESYRAVISSLWTMFPAALGLVIFAYLRSARPAAPDLIDVLIGVGAVTAVLLGTAEGTVAVFAVLRRSRLRQSLVQRLLKRY